MNAGNEGHPYGTAKPFAALAMQSVLYVGEDMQKGVDDLLCMQGDDGACGDSPLPFLSKGGLVALGEAG